MFFSVFFCLKLFERMVGQSEEFWEYFQPLVEEKFEHMKGVPASAYYDAINQVSLLLLAVVLASDLALLLAGRRPGLWLRGSRTSFHLTGCA